MAIRISSQQHAQLLEWAQLAGEEECCGLIFGENGVVGWLQLAPNVAPDRTRYFEIDPASLIAAEKAARLGEANIMAYFHSHPSGLMRPSAADAEMAGADGRDWLIIAAGQITAWRFLKSTAAFDAVELIIDG